MKQSQSGFALLLALGFIATLSVALFGLINQVMLLLDQGRNTYERQQAYHLAQQGCTLALAQLTTPWFVPDQKSDQKDKKFPEHLIPLAVINRWQTITFDPTTDGGLDGTVQIYIVVQEGGLALGAVARAQTEKASEISPLQESFKLLDTTLTTLWGPTQGQGGMGKLIAEVAQSGRAQPVLFEDPGCIWALARRIWTKPPVPLITPEPAAQSKDAPRVGSLSELWAVRVPTQPEPEKTAPKNQKPTPGTEPAASKKPPAFNPQEDGLALLYLTPVWARIAGLPDQTSQQLADRVSRMQEMAKPGDKGANQGARELELWWGMEYAKWPEGIRAIGNPGGRPRTVQVIVRATFHGTTVKSVWYATWDDTTGRYIPIRRLFDL